ncbi:MAG: hypothetical protein ABJ314_11520 [Ilumatobacter sp.]|uniref:hypothetical protein n=1 Tax=Ilumatobacter sp. TaxID=1967498 RepID=UPI003297F56D
MSRNNVIWLAVVLVAAGVGWFVGGWKIALVAAAIGLVVSEVFERRARAARSVD